jgi:outer membrane protein TolC
VTYGYVNYLTLLSAQITCRQALATRVQAQAARFGDTAALYQALGCGWWHRDGQQTASPKVGLARQVSRCRAIGM